MCELTQALDVSQPKISRHLAQLRECGLLLDRREGLWVYYRINAELPEWALNVLSITAGDNVAFVQDSQARLCCMGDRPQRKQRCC